MNADSDTPERPAQTALPARFAHLRTLGRGGMGVVYAAYDRTRRMPVAVKQLSRVDGAHVYRFKREFRAVRDLSHANIVQLYELVSEGDDWFLTMEIVDGVDFMAYVSGREDEVASTRSDALGDTYDPALDATIGATRTSLSLMDSSERASASAPAPVAARLPPMAERPSLDPRLVRDRVRPAFLQLADALCALHAADIIHRDLKPHNVMVTGDGRVVLMDFGMVAELRVSGGERAGAVMGTPLYMAPEQAAGAPITTAADWYAFGVILYQALSGRTPQHGSALELLAHKHDFELIPPSRHAAGVPADLEDLCLSLLDKRPEHRPTGAEVRARLGSERAPGVAAMPVTPADQLADQFFVGRGPELRLLWQNFDAVLTGPARAVLVRGRSGMGKSRLLDRFLAEVTGPGRAAPLVLSGRCHECESLPYKAFDSVIDALCHDLLARPADERARLLPEHASALARLFPVLHKLPELTRADLDLTPSSLRAHALQALRELVHALARRQPVIIRVEDFHWSDTDSRDLCAAMLEAPLPERLLVLISCRAEDEYRDSVTALRQLLERHATTTVLDLGPLADAEERELVRRLSGDSEPLGQAESALLAECAGHPMLVHEMVRYLGQARARGESLPLDALSMETLLWRRIQDLPAPARSLLLAAGAAGEPSPLWMVAEVAELDPAVRERALADARLQSLLRITRAGAESWIDTFHDKVREAVSQHMSPDQTAEVHRRWAGILGSEADAPAARIAGHWLAAGERRAAIEYWIAGARAAHRQLAFAGAIRLYQEALRTIEGGGRDAALDAIQATVRIELAGVLRALDRSDQALAELEHAQRLTERLGLVRERAEVHYLRGSLLFPRGDIEGCKREHEQARALAQSVGSADCEARALSGLGDAHYLGGALASALHYFGECLALCLAHGLDEHVPVNLAMAGLIRVYLGDMHRGRAEIERALDLSVASGSARSEALILTGILPGVFIESDELERAMDTLGRGIELARGLGTPRFEVMGLTYLATVHRFTGRRAQAERIAQETLETLRQDAVTPFFGPVLFGVLAWSTGDPAARDSFLSLGLSLLDRGAQSHSHFYCHRFAMESGLETGDHALVERALHALDRYTRETPTDWRDAWIERARATMASRTSAGRAAARPQLLALRERALARGFLLEARLLSRVLDPADPSPP